MVTIGYGFEHWHFTLIKVNLGIYCFLGWGKHDCIWQCHNQK